MRFAGAQRWLTAFPTALPIDRPNLRRVMADDEYDEYNDGYGPDDDPYAAAGVPAGADYGTDGDYLAGADADEYGDAQQAGEYGDVNAYGSLPPSAQYGEEEYGQYALPPESEPIYDYPASPAGKAHASTGSMPEEIDVTTSGLIEETVQRLSIVHGVLGVLIVDAEGRIVHATMPMEEAAKLAGPTLQLLQRARSCAALTADDELRMLCVRTRKYELLLCSEAEGAYAVCVLQDIHPVVGEAAGAPSSEPTPAARSVLRAAAGTLGF